MPRAKNLQDTFEEEGRIGFLDIKTSNKATLTKMVCIDAGRDIGKWIRIVQK